MRHLLVTLPAALTLARSGCGYNTFQSTDEQTQAGWSEVLNQYQRRANLISNVVAIVKGEANVELETLTKAVEARAQAASIQATPELADILEAFNKFPSAQRDLSSALSRLLVATKTYPNLRGNFSVFDKGALAVPQKVDLGGIGASGVKT